MNLNLIALIRTRLAFILALSMLFLAGGYEAMAQTYTDGPIQLQVKVREIQTYFDPFDQGLFGVGFSPDEMRYNVWGKDDANVSGLPWQGGACLQWNGNPSIGGAPSPDFNYMIWNYTYPTNSVPQTFDVRLKAWEDDSPDGILGLGCGGSDCVYEASYCCGGTIPIIGGCVLSHGDVELCDANPFQVSLDYRLGPPCRWYDFGLVNMLPGACANPGYKPHIQSYWRYTKGTSCADAIPLGLFSAGSSILHYNNNECYSNNYPGSPGNDVYYSFSINGPIGINANLCGPSGAQFNSVLYLLDNNCNQMTFNDDGCGVQSNISTYLCQPGTYYLVVDGATAADQGLFTLTLQQDTNLTFKANLVTTDVDCYGAHDGRVRANVTGGVPATSGPPYTYLWSTGATIDSITNLGPGTYTVTVTDSRGCTTSASATVAEPPQLVVASITSTPVTCSGYRDGSATVIPTGGTPPYRYFWAGNPPQVTQTAVSLPQGNIVVTIIDNNNCVIVDSVVVNASTVIVNTLDNLSNVTCFGANDGSISITITGGTPPYIYQWSSGPTTDDITNLAPGTYDLTVTDQNACSITGTYNITEPPLLTVQLNDSANVRCNGGSDGAITVVANGGVQPYTYLWSNGRTTQDLLNVTAGAYTLTVTDAHGCTAILAHTITEPPAITLAFNPTNPACFGGNDGVIDLTVTGGTQPYQYLWTNNAVTEDITNLTAGVYGVLVTDSNNCFKFDFQSLTTNPPVDVQLQSQGNISCFGGSNGYINLNITGGAAGAYTFTWSDPSATGQNPTGLAAGTYKVTVADANGCSDSLTVILTESPLLSVNLVKIDSVTCYGLHNGSISIDVLGGVQPYSYLWSDNAVDEDRLNIGTGTYSITVTDANNCTATLQNLVVPGPSQALATTLTGVNPSCFGVSNGSVDLTVTGGTTPYTYNWNNGPHTEDQTSLDGGRYAVEVIDYSGCTAFDTITLVPASAVSIAESITDLICHGTNNGQISLTVTGGTSPYTYSWSNSSTANPLTGLAGGTYDVTVTDAQGCAAHGTYDVAEPDSIALNIIGTNVTCFGDKNGVATPLIEGGTPNYTYAWSDGETGPIASSLDPLTYTLTVTDANGCTVTKDVTISGPAELVLSVDSVLSNQCFGDQNGTVSTHATGGTRPYQFSVLNNVSQPDSNFVGLDAGNYTAVVLDANNCRATSNFTISEPTDWSIKFKDPYVFVSRGAYVYLQPILSDSSLAPYTYSWVPATGLDCDTCATVKASPVETTTYTVTITDKNNCSHEAQIVVVVKDGYEIFYPNVFSPNGDGNNDTWAPIDFGAAKTMNVKIFNRWGEKVFETSELEKGWDGTYKGSIMAPDTYIYVVHGTYQNGKEFSKTGSFALIR